MPSISTIFIKDIGYLRNRGILGMRAQNPNHFHSSHPYRKHTAWHCSNKIGELRVAVRGMNQKPFHLFYQLIKTINRLHRFHSSHPYRKHTAWHCSHKVGELRVVVRGMTPKPFHPCNLVDKNNQQITQISQFSSIWETYRMALLP